MTVVPFALLVFHQWSLGYTSEIRPRPVIVGGSPIAIEEAPFMAMYCNANCRVITCGASIITDRFVLSAAHCHGGSQKSKFKNVIVGTDKRSEGGQIYKIKKSIVHPNYSFSSYDNDVVVLILRGRITFSEKVQPIKMADANSFINKGAALEVFGFGDTYNDARVGSERLLTVTIPYVSSAKCRRIFNEVGLKFTDNMICAGETGKDSCQGDSGGPLVYNNTLVGVVSFGEKCGVYPGAYARVAKLRNFIDIVIEKYSYNKNHHE